MNILVTGFDPFGGESVNPAWEAVKSLADRINGAAVKKIKIPVVFGRSAEVVRQAIEEYAPDVVLNVGQAGGRSAISIERVAINVDDARIPDNAGNQPIDMPIQLNGASAYFSKLPLKAMVGAIKKTGIAGEVSNTAGTFVCNHMMYQVHYLIATEFPGIRGGFIHVPYLPEQVANQPDQPYMTLQEIVSGLTAAIEAAVEYDGKRDIKSAEGAIS